MGTLIHVEHGSPRIVEELPDWTPHRLAVINQFWMDEHAFSAEDEYAYQVEQPPEFSAIQKILCHLFYNPRQTIDGKWNRIGPYRKEVLVSYVEKGLETDDDIIQQWFGANEVLALLNAADTFDEMLVAVDAVCGGHEVNKDTLEYVESILGPSWTLDA